jgi:hypothetical protein
MMKQYIQQLIEELEQAACNPPQAPFIEPPAHLAEDPVISELALVPFKTIEEWTGISSMVFPEMIDLNGDECQQVNEAIFKVYESLNLNLDDLPDQIPPEMLYEILRTVWDDYPVQYLPSSVMDVDLCSGDPDTCPYGIFCSCNEPVDESWDLPAGNNENEDLWELDGTGDTEWEDNFFEGGLFNDDGIRIDPDQVPVPSLCIICKQHLSDDEEENILCLLTRNDQRNDDGFECGMFEKI